jgi:hypothetical protein
MVMSDQDGGLAQKREVLEELGSRPGMALGELIFLSRQMVPLKDVVRQRQLSDIMKERGEVEIEALQRGEADRRAQRSRIVRGSNAVLIQTPIPPGQRVEERPHDVPP